MLQPVLRVFGVEPDFDLALMRAGQTPAAFLARALRAVDRVLEGDTFDAVVVQGDTTTTLAAALAAFHRRVPLVHVEAGLRTGDLDRPFPEEGNRKLTTAVARWHCAATESAKRNLVREGVRPTSVIVTGNTVVDALQWLRSELSDPRVARRMRSRFRWLEGVHAAQKRMVLVTAHRRESIGAGIERICLALARLARRDDVEIVYPVHLNPGVRGPVHRLLRGRPNVRLVPAQDYLHFVYLMTEAHLILTDSGGVQEEAPSLGKPVLVLRDVTERTEAVEAGTARLVGTDPARIEREARRLLDDPRAYAAMRRADNPYGDGRASERIAVALERWLGVTTTADLTETA